MICIGNIRTADIKKLTFRLISKYPDKLSSDFEGNKKFIRGLNILHDKKVRNRVAGYVTRRERVEQLRAKLQGI